ncbi:uncharacterized protein [Choristoneura fumiferana]|uniref:uncharacterized protein n=1 Tax=Choristoneura fumiferana TaxID=7141 RepID=UPI003D15D5DF
MGYKSIALLIVTLHVVWSSNCGREDLNTLFEGDSHQCNTEETWTVGHAPAGLDNNNDVSNFLTPGTLSSCITSRAVPLSSQGLVEVNVYAKSIQNNDFVSVTIYEAVENNLVGNATLFHSDFEDGWNNLKIILDGAGNFEGYVMIMGQASSDSVILLGSVCYKSPSAKDYLPLPPLDKISKLTSNYNAPDIYVLQIHSVLTNLANPKVATDFFANEVDINDGVISEDRTIRFIDFDDFWTPLTISLAVIIPVLIVALLGWGCYALGKRKGAKKEPEIIYEDVNTIPKPYLVPRVKGVYSESVAGSSYGGRNDNIYSV